MQLVTLPWEQAQYLRRLPAGLYLGEGCNLYQEDASLAAIEEGSFSAYRWEGQCFAPLAVERPFQPAALTREPLAAAPLEAPTLRELFLGGGSGPSPGSGFPSPRRRAL